MREPLPAASEFNIFIYEFNIPHVSRQSGSNLFLALLKSARVARYYELIRNMLQNCQTETMAEKKMILKALNSSLKIKKKNFIYIYN